MNKILFLVPFILVSCKPCERLAKKCPPQIKDSIIYTETIKEDTAYTIPDSVYWNFVFECDSNYNVLLRDYETINTGIHSEVIIKEVPVTNQKVTKRLSLRINAQTDSIETLNRTITKLKSEQKTIIKEIEVKVPEKYVPRVYKWSLLFSIFVILIIILYIYLKIKGLPFKLKP